MTERDFEEIICRYPCLIEDGAVFENRQVTVKTKRLDVLLRDKDGKRMLLELKAGAVTRADMAQLFEYEGFFIEQGENDVRVFLVGTSVPLSVQKACEKHGVEWRELVHLNLLSFLQAKGDQWAANLVKSGSPLEVERSPAHKKSVCVQPCISTPLPPPRRAGISRKADDTWQLKYFNQLLAMSNKQLDLFRCKPSECKPGVAFLGVNAGVSRTDWNYRKDCVLVAFFDGNKEKNTQRFEYVKRHKQEIEEAFGEDLFWNYKDGRTYQHIVSKSKVGTPYCGNESEWPSIQADLVNRMKRLITVIRPYLPKE